jgi:MFS family permease
VVINVMMQRVPAFTAIILGTLLTSLAFVILILHPTVFGVVVTLVVVALGEITQSPRYYEYISRLAPPGQQGTYMGFAFLPLGVGSLVAGPLGGFLLHHFGEVKHQPQMMWWTVIGIGVLTTVLLWIYDKTLRPKEAAGS